jgi:hypothetical protein
LLTAHGAIGVHSLRQHNVTVDEGGHILAGVLAWEQGRLDFYPVNPPLVRGLVALPAVASRPTLSPSVSWTVSPDWVPQHHEFMEDNRTRYMEMVFRARYVLVAMSVLGAWLTYRWSTQLFGSAAGLVGLSLWAFCPNILAWAGVCTVDLGATVLGLAAVYAFRQYLRGPGPLTATWAGAVLGLALLSKFTLLVLYPVFFVIGLAAWLTNRPRIRFVNSLAGGAEFTVIVVVSLLVVKMGYGFEGAGRALGDLPFRSRSLGKLVETRWVRATWIARCPVPLPEGFLLGLDEQMRQADAGFPAYLRGRWQHGGWWYYYLYALGVKLPLGTLCLVALGGALLVCARRCRAPLIEELLLWLPAAAIGLLISSETGINSHLRYVLPMFPFLFIATSRVGQLLVGPWKRSAGRRCAGPLVGAALVTAALAWNVTGVVRIHPHYLSYFNELAGGPENGWQHLLESNIDWGQDLLFLKAWVDRHPDVEPLGLAYYGGMDPHLLGLRYRLPPPAREAGRVKLPPGWYAVSVNFVCGTAFMAYDGDGKVVNVPMGAYDYFHDLTPVAKAGYSIFIYRITP